MGKIYIYTRTVYACSVWSYAAAENAYGDMIADYGAGDEYQAAINNAKTDAAMQVAIRKAEFDALKKVLARLVRDGHMTQEEADAELAKWLADHPGAEDPIDVTQEFEKAQKRVLVDVERE